MSFLLLEHAVNSFNGDYLSSSIFFKHHEQNSFCLCVADNRQRRISPNFSIQNQNYIHVKLTFSLFRVPAIPLKMMHDATIYFKYRPKTCKHVVTLKSSLQSSAGLHVGLH